MARKRGGIAGLYDKSKGVLRYLAPAALSFVPGVGIPLAAAAGAALGADTEGRKYFDRRNIGGAIRGGLEGLAIGGTTQAAVGGVKKLADRKMQEMFDRGYGQATRRFVGDGGAGMTPAPTGAASSAAAAAPSAPSASSVQQLLAPSPSAGPSLGRQLLDQMSEGQLRNLARAPGAGGGRGAGLLAGLRENKDLLTMAGKGLQSVLPNAASDAAMMNAETQRMLANQQITEQQREEERRRRIAELLMPFARQQFPDYFRNT